MANAEALRAAVVAGSQAIVLVPAAMEVECAACLRAGVAAGSAAAPAAEDGQAAVVEPEAREIPADADARRDIFFPQACSRMQSREQAFFCLHSESYNW